MTNPVSNPQQNYSGVTIQITNPTVNAGGAIPQACNCQACQPKINGGVVTNPMNQVLQPLQQPVQVYPGVDIMPAKNYAVENYSNPQNETTASNNSQKPNNQDSNLFPSYPQQYYLNNYNIQGNPDTVGKVVAETQKTQDGYNNPAENPSDIKAFENGGNINQNPQYMNYDSSNMAEPGQQPASEQKPKTYQELLEDAKKYEKPVSANDMTKSTEIKEDLDARALAAENEKKNSKQKNVVALTDEYIKSLENYLNNPNDEIRLMASKDILTRLDEDKDRYDDAALNALLNKMLQDPSKLIRVAALSAFASQLASGNDYTVQLLHNIQQNPNADKEDVIQAADILLKMSAGREIKNIPNPSVKNEKEGNHK